MPDLHGQPQVSILLGLYNGQEFLASTLESAFAQTYTDFELIVINDGSTDQSPAVLDGCRDSRLRIVHQENQGASGALATGLSIAKGKYIAFLDQDDLWEPDSLAAHIDFLERHPEIEVTFSWFRIIDARGQSIGLHSRRHAGTIGFSGLLTDFVIGGTSNVVCRRTAIDRAGGIDTSMRLLYVVDLCLRIALLSPRDNIAAIPRELMSYRRHASQLSRLHERSREEWLRLLEQVRPIAPRQVAEAEPRARANIDRYAARVLYESARYGEALKTLAAGFRKVPGPFLADARNWITGGACLSGFLLPDGLHRALERLAGYHRPHGR